jgi:hypothetical protein
MKFNMEKYLYIMKTILTFFFSALIAIECMVAQGNISLERAAELERLANESKLSADSTADPRLAEIAGGLKSDDVFVRALAHAAAAQLVGHANNKDVVRISPEDAAKSDAPQWLKAYAAVNVSELPVYDWIRHLALEGKLFSAAKLREEISLYSERAKKMGAESAGIDAIVVGSATADEATCRQLWLDARRQLRVVAFHYAELDDKNSNILLFTRQGFHYKPNVCGVHTNWSYKPGGDLMVVDAGTGAAGPLLQGKLGQGHLHGFDLHYNADRVVFAYARQPVWPPPAVFSTVWPGDNNARCNDNASFAHELRELGTLPPPSIYELDLSDGNITQLTGHSYWSDVEPVYLPDGSIVFSSDRAANSPSCDSYNNDLTDLNLYVLSPERTTIRRLLNHKDIDMHPHVLNNGLIAYLRWEYQERYFMETHSVWTVRPDGTGADALFKQHNIPIPYSVRLASSLGESGDRLIAIAAGHHALPQGPIVLLDPSGGGNDGNGIRLVTDGIKVYEGKVPYPMVAEGGRTDAGGYYTEPYALSEKSFLVSYGFPSTAAKRYSYWNGDTDVDANGYGVYLVDVFGNKELVYRDPFTGALNARPLHARKTPPVLPSSVDYTKNYAVCNVPDIYQGMDSVERGTVKYIRISEALPWPVVPGEGVKRWVNANYTWDDRDATRWCPVRVLGEVPVEDDGSAHFKVPVSDNASVYFQALDEHYREVRRMRSSVSFAPGEQRGCMGCHETNTAAPATAMAKSPVAITRAPSEPVPPRWGSRRPVHFERDIAPIFANNCASCHSGTSPAADLDFSASKVFRTVKDKKLVECSSVKMNSDITKPEQFGSRVSRLTRALENPDLKQKMKINLSTDDLKALYTWVDANIPHSGEMLHKRTADGKLRVWAPFDWGDPWAFPRKEAAIEHPVPAVVVNVVQK